LLKECALEWHTNASLSNGLLLAFDMSERQLLPRVQLENRSSKYEQVQV